MEFTDVVKARHSYRGFLPKAVDEQTLQDVFELANWAPSNCNIQPWHAMLSPVMPVIDCVKR